MKNHFLKPFMAVSLVTAQFLALAGHAATVTWVGESGDWNTATNWSTGALPGTTDDVVIASGPSITITHSSGAHTVRSITNQQTFVLSGGILTVSDTFLNSNTFNLSGGTLRTATVITTNGASLIVSSGTLNGVTVNGVLDVGNTDNGAGLTVTNGLTINGTVLMGNPTNGYWGLISFAGTQTLGGNGAVVFGNASTCGGYPYNRLAVADAGTTLTIGSGITVEGQNGSIGYMGPCFGGPQNVEVINQGTISDNVNGGIIVIAAQPLVNGGSVEMSNGGSLNINSLANVVGLSASGNGTLTLNGNWVNNEALTLSGTTLSLGGSWTNMGTINATNATINLGGTFTVSDIGVLNQSNSTIYLTGALVNSNATLALNAASGSWVLASGGTIEGGTVITTNGASLIVSSGTLNGLTVNGVLDVGNTDNGAGLTVTNGLTINGTVLVGNPTNSYYGVIDFAGTQTFGGNGTVVFGNASTCGGYPYNRLAVADAGTTLTIGSGITVEGQNGSIGYMGACFGGPQNVEVVNQGTISADVNGGIIVIAAQPFSNQGLAQAINGGTLNLQGAWNNTGTLVESGGTIDLGGNFTVANVGTLNQTNGAIYLTGILTNTSTTWTNTTNLSLTLQPESLARSGKRDFVGCFGDKGFGSWRFSGAKPSLGAFLGSKRMWQWNFRPARAELSIPID